MHLWCLAPKSVSIYKGMYRLSDRGTKRQSEIQSERSTTNERYKGQWQGIVTGFYGSSVTVTVSQSSRISQGNIVTPAFMAKYKAS